jgi:hypothetical protein
MLGVHIKTLLKAHRLGVGPQPEPKDRYTHNQLFNQLFWKPAALLVWWQRQAGLPEHSAQEILDEWLATRPDSFELKLEGPPLVLGRQLRRRRRDEKRRARRPSGSSR